MPSQDIRVSATTSAGPEAVYALLRDGATWPEWSPLGSFELERAGEAEPEGLGAIRVFRTGRVTTREEIVELVPARRFSYVLLSGLPLRNYRADVDLEPADGGARITWHSSFDQRLPGTGWLFRRQLGGFLQRTVDGLARRAGERNTG
jgi:polyketide cyclase/dehydrase/lipid transport protein